MIPADGVRGFYKVQEGPSVAVPAARVDIQGEDEPRGLRKLTYGAGHYAIRGPVAGYPRSPVALGSFTQNHVTLRGLLKLTPGAALHTLLAATGCSVVSPYPAIPCRTRHTGDIQSSTCRLTKPNPYLQLVDIFTHSLPPRRSVSGVDPRLSRRVFMGN